jgi:HSP20 family protein
MMSSIAVPRWVVRGTDPIEVARREFQKAFGNAAHGQRTANGGCAPLSVWEDQQQLYLEVDLPGLQPEDVDVTVENGKLSIRGERKPSEGAQKRYDERAYGRFERVIALADTIDQASVVAQLRDGVLRVTLSKKPEVQPQRVVVKYQGERPTAGEAPVNGSQH